MVTGLGVRQPRLDVLPGRAAGITRRQQVDIDRARLPDRAGAGPPVQQIRQRRDVPSLWSQGHRSHATPRPLSSIRDQGPWRADRLFGLGPFFIERFRLIGSAERRQHRRPLIFVSSVS
jgi:hypothetical protein